MSKYNRQTFCEGLSSCCLIPFGNKVGLTERINAIRFTNPDCVVQVWDRCGDLPSAEVYVILHNPFDTISDEVINSLTGNHGFCAVVTNYAESPSFTKEYEAYLNNLQSVLPDLLDLLPDSHPKKAQLIAERSRF